MIKVFGIWLVLSNIAYLQPINQGKGCEAYFTGVGFSWYSERKITFDAPCDTVAKKINAVSEDGESK